MGGLTLPLSPERGIRANQGCVAAAPEDPGSFGADHIMVVQVCLFLPSQAVGLSSHLMTPVSPPALPTSPRSLVPPFLPQRGDGG